MRTTPRPPRRDSALIQTVAAVLLTLAVCACSKGEGNSRDKGPPEVGFRVMQATSVPIVTELPGRITALRTAEVRPQISGVILKRLYAEGALVRQGQPLYQIDPSIYRAAAAQASANLASAQAQAEAARAKADRFRPLAREQAIAQQDYTDALAASRAANAAVAQNRAALNTAQINLRFATIPAPLTGRIGRSLFTEGALVTTGQADPLAVISVLDPIYVDIQQSSSELLQLRRQLAAGGVAPVTAEVRLKLDDGSDYELPGTVEFSEVTADPGTGTVTLRARFANPQGLLMPGMFARARFAQSRVTGAFLVPQAALTRDPKGNAEVYVVGPDNKAVIRTVTAVHTQGNDWIVTQGLKAGDRVIIQGLGKVRANQPVKPVPETASQAPRTGDQKSPAAGKAG
ncbi:efflux RND transporter periplasmic adaptor subunit [Novosphingobium sp. JCM 18896]|uniref:efflux RND transporter periplasmic adaptor subunit n=1 Tax=Novosphingobium sp. JCM 18896 TaxID=2989731 RepID=UPI0022236839|nr:efflux RND transporter periplasmic adaptor subunit [Novosphingobium sp. JCM 18896]